MKKLFPFALMITLTLAACGPSAGKLNNQGNDAFINQDYSTALTAYQQAQSEMPEAAEPHYNAANTLYRQGNYVQAQGEIDQTLIKDDGDLTQNSVYNLGNTFFQGQQFDQAIEAYKEALRLNPNDIEAKHNLELALQQMQQQQQEQQQEEQQEQQQDQNQDQNNEQQDQQQDGQQGDQQQEQNQDQQQDGQQGDQQQKQNQDQQQNGQPNDQQQEQNHDQQQNGQQGDPQDQPQNKQQQGDPPQGDQPSEQQPDDQPSGQPQVVQGLTPEQAKQLFEAATQGTESLEEHLQQILVIPGGQPGQDW